MNIVRKDYNSLLNRRDTLDSEIKKMKTDDGMEEEIRSKFDVSRPGEVIVSIVDNSNEKQEEIGKKDGFWQKIKNIFN